MRHRPLAPRTAWILLAPGMVALCVASCGKRDAASETRPSSAAPDPSAGATTVASSPAASPEAGAVRFMVDPGGTATIDMPGVTEDIRGDASGARGTFDLVAADLARSRGRVEFDLATFATHTFHTDKDATQTEHARTWLEVKVGDKQNEEMRWATFTVTSVEAPGTASLALAPLERDGGDETRTVRMKLHGDLRLHGRSLPQVAAVEAVFRFAPGAPAGSAPRRVEVRSVEPIHVVLKDYDVRPRDPAGQLVAWTTQLVSKVAETADVTVEFAASPAR